MNSLSSLKKIGVFFIAGILGGIIAVVFVLPILLRIGVLDGGYLLGQFGAMREASVTKIEEKPIFIPRSDYFSEAIDKIKPAVVAIQSFSSGTLVRSGSGMILTQDGLIVTLNSIVPPAQVVQVTAGNKIYSGRVIFRNYSNNLAIISINESGLQTAELKFELPTLGQKLLIFAKTANFGKDLSLVGEALVSQIDVDRGQLKIAIAYDQLMFGSALVDNSGSILGVLDFRNQKPLVIGAKLLEKTLSAALTERNRQK